MILLNFRFVIATRAFFYETHEKPLSWGIERMQCFVVDKNNRIMP